VTFELHNGRYFCIILPKASSIFLSQLRETNWS